MADTTKILKNKNLGFYKRGCGNELKWHEVQEELKLGKRQHIIASEVQVSKGFVSNVYRASLRGQYQPKAPGRPKGSTKMPPEELEVLKAMVESTPFGSVKEIIHGLKQEMPDHTTVCQKSIQNYLHSMKISKRQRTILYYVIIILLAIFEHPLKWSSPEKIQYYEKFSRFVIDSDEKTHIHWKFFDEVQIAKTGKFIFCF